MNYLSKDYWIKHCPKCYRINYQSSEVCEFCGYKYHDYKLTKKERLISFDKLVEDINKAFYRLEGFMNEFITSYQKYDFVHSFEILFTKAKQQENVSYKNTNLILSYYKLISQISYDSDKGNFKNREAFKNKEFEEDINSLDYILNCLNYKFSEFVSNDEIEYSSKGFSIKNILNERSDVVQSKKLSLTPPENLHIQFSTLEIKQKVFELLKPYFSNSEVELLRALSGNFLDYPIHFNYSQNKLIEVFSRLHYNGFVISTLTEIKTWLCKNFTFLYKRGNIKEERGFNEETVRQQLFTGKGEPNIKSRICVTEWLPYKEPLSIKGKR